jgi:hypothetical protein
VDDSGTLDEEEFEELAQAVLSRLDFVVIYLGNDHDPQEVFDRLNRAGIKLSLADLLKNVIFKPIDLASANHSDVHQLDATVWQPFFNKLGADDQLRSAALADFVFPYAVVKSTSATKATGIDLVEKDWVEAFKGLEPLDQVKERVKDMSGYLEGFLALRYGPKPSAYPVELQKRLARLHRFDLPGIATPFFVEAMKSYREGNLTEQDFCRSIDVIESFLVRRVFMGIEPTGLHAVFKKLWTASRGAPELVKSGLQTRTVKFPTDAEFFVAARDGALYLRRKHKYILLERELAIPPSVPTKDLSEIQADHLIPQKRPTGSWPDLTDEDHARILHQWGNIALMTKPENTIKSNRTWDETRLLFGSLLLFASARQVIDNFVTFSAPEVEARNTELATWAKSRWSEGP